MIIQKNVDLDQRLINSLAQYDLLTQARQAVIVALKKQHDEELEQLLEAILQELGES
ncbi:hypothetical protein [Arcanobacterium haemolyticum]